MAIPYILFSSTKLYIPSTSHVKTIYSFQYIRLYSDHITQVTWKKLPYKYIFYFILFYFIKLIMCHSKKKTIRCVIINKATNNKNKTKGCKNTPDEIVKTSDLIWAFNNYILYWSVWALNVGFISRLDIPYKTSFLSK